MNDSRDAAAAALDGIAAKEGVVGVALVARDGLPVVHRFNRSCSEDAVCAMGAAMIGAADAALLDLGQGDADAFKARSGDLWFAGAGLDDDLIVLVVATGDIDALLDEATGALRGILKEA